MSGEISVDVTVKDNSKEVINEARNKIEIALESIGLIGETSAKLLCPVDTGILRNSITHEVNGNAVIIGTNVEYGKYVELGTARNKGGQPFLKTSIEGNMEEFKQIIEKELKG